MEKFRNQNPDMKEPINQWLAFIDMERGDLLEMAKKNSKIIKEAYGEYEVLTGEDEVKRLAEVRLMSKLEEQAALAAARKEGYEKGFKKGRVMGLLKSNMPIEQIIEITELDKQEIEKIKQENEA